MRDAKYKGHLLIVDDEEGIRMMLETKLFNDGYQVSTASNGLHAIQKLKSKKYDLVICDLKMPGMSGVELIKKAHKNELNSAPFLLITGSPEKERIIEAVQRGVSDVLLKPLKHQDLLKKIHQLLEESGKLVEVQNRESLSKAA